MTPWRHPLLLVLLASGGAIAIFATAPQPFLWTLLLWTTLAGTGALWVRQTGPKVALVNVAAVLTVLTAYEGYLWLRDLQSDPTRLEGSYTTDYFVADDLLGYGPAKPNVATAVKYHDDKPIYRVEYTIGADGLRVSPPAVAPELGCALFFGGSVTFGEGVADDQSMPYQLGALTGHRYRVYNFGFHGYGPHQMLAALEGGRVAEIARCRPSHVIYQAIIPHVERAAGLATWDKHGPRYVLAPAMMSARVRNAFSASTMRRYASPISMSPKSAWSTSTPRCRGWLPRVRRGTRPAVARVAPPLADL